jgi:DNA modification methylase
VQVKSLVSSSGILKRVDWDFEDFTSRNLKLDINFLHWYPASFIPQIPDVIIQTLSREGECVVDPFAGSGVTLVEAAKLGRRFVGTDSNPFAVEISKAKFLAIENARTDWQETLNARVTKNIIDQPAEDYLETHNIVTEASRWFERETLRELLSIHEAIVNGHGEQFLLEKVVFSSILSSCCSQRRHYTYITDGCYPEKLLYKPAKKIFAEKVRIVSQSAEVFREQFRRRHSREYKYDGIIDLGDARELHWIKDNSADLVVTSPPYLCTHDYLKAMRLTNLFFPEKDFKSRLENEIGARCKRGRTSAYEDYVRDIEGAFQECHRMLKFGGFMGLVIGAGSGRVVKSNVIEQLLDFLTDRGAFTAVYKTTRRINNRRIRGRTPGVLCEHIVILEKTGKETICNDR